MALQLLQDGLERAPSASLQIGIAIYHKDEAQLASIIEMEFPIVQHILESFSAIESETEGENQMNITNSNSVQEALLFIKNLAHCLGDTGPEILQQFYPLITNIISKLELSDSIISQPNYCDIIVDAIDVASSLCKRTPEVFHEHLIQLITKIFSYSDNEHEIDNDDLENKIDDLVQVAITSIGKISYILSISNPEFLFFSTQKIIEIFRSTDKTDETLVQKLCLKSLTKICKVDKEKMPPNVISCISEFVSTIIDPEQSNNIINLSNPIIYELICLFFGDFFRFHVSFYYNGCNVKMNMIFQML